MAYAIPWINKYITLSVPDLSNGPKCPLGAWCHSAPGSYGGRGNEEGCVLSSFCCKVISYKTVRTQLYLRVILTSMTYKHLSFLPKSSWASPLCDVGVSMAPCCIGWKCWEQPQEWQGEQVSRAQAFFCPACSALPWPDNEVWSWRLIYVYWIMMLFALFLEEPCADYHLCDIRCQPFHSLGPMSFKTSWMD